MSDIQIVGGDSDNNDSSTLNSKRSNISFGKLAVIFIIGLIIIATGLVGTFFYFKGALNFGSESQEKTQEMRSYEAAPDALGRYQPPPETKEPKPLLPEPEKAPEPVEAPVAPEPAPAPLLAEAKTSNGDQPTLAERRYASKVSQYQQRDEPAPEIPKRQVKLMTNIDYVLIKGTTIPCTLEMNIVSEQPGFTSCVINQDVYSSNARMLLIEKGSKVTGEYNSGLKNGERRLTVVWDRIVTPYDVVVQLDSPSTGRLGQAGITGKVDNRWGTRIGSALLVSIFEDALNVLGQHNKNVNDLQTKDASKDLAKKILDKNIDLPPIVYIPEGKTINIYIADDIDMSSIYNVRNSK